VEWQPIVGMLPPVSDAQWQEAFYKYQQTPEYQKVNFGMSLDAFKRIFWWEYFHRLLGRAVGLVFFLPLLYFALSRRIGPGLALRLFGIFLLGALQAPPDPVRRRLYRFAAGLSALIFLMALSGGLVAGIHAGLAYNTFPLMNGHLLPPEYLALQPWYRNLFNNVAAVQFDHRLIAWLLAILVPLFWLGSRRVQLVPRARLACNILVLALALQIALGISTLLLMVPVPLAAAHQAGALTLFATSLWVSHELR
jgi:heme a synthase